MKAFTRIIAAISGAIYLGFHLAHANRHDWDLEPETGSIPSNAATDYIATLTTTSEMPPADSWDWNAGDEHEDEQHLSFESGPVGADAAPVSRLSV